MATFEDTQTSITNESGEPVGQVDQDKVIEMRNQPVAGRPVNAIYVDNDGVVAATWGKEVSNYQLSPEQGQLMIATLEAQDSAGKNLMEYIPSNHLVDMVVALDTREMSQSDFDQSISELTDGTKAIRAQEKLDGLRGDDELSATKQMVLNRMAGDLNDIPDVIQPTTPGM